MEYNQNQRHLQACELRLRGLANGVSRGELGESELNRITAARNEIRSRMTDTELAAYDAHQNRVLTPAQLADEAKQRLKVMNENRDKPSI